MVVLRGRGAIWGGWLFSRIKLGTWGPPRCPFGDPGVQGLTFKCAFPGKEMVIN